MLYLIWTVVIIATLTLYFRQFYLYFDKHGMKHLQPIPVLGNMFRILFRLSHITSEMDRLYNAFPEERFVGRYEFFTPMVMVRNLELIKKIVIKDFDHFLDRRTVVDKESDPLFGRTLVSLKGQEWKHMRSTLSPAFTSSKIRLMVPFMVKVGDQMIKSLNIKMQAGGVDYVDIDCRDLLERYGNDVIAMCSFGLKVDSFLDNDEQFFVVGKEASTFTFHQLLILFGFSSFPKLMKSLKQTLFTKASKDFFRFLVLDSIKDREKRNITRPDMVHLLMEVNKEWSDDDLAAQSVLFFLGGFDTVPTAMVFLLHELALNPEIQDRLVQEIRENVAQNKGKFDYSSIQKMVYLDMVVSEVLRLWPPMAMLDRLCVKDYNMGKPNKKAKEDFILRKGSGLNIPAWCFHRDPQYFREPHKFDPERFSEENKHNINPFTYMPFGLGQRSCIASRFVLCNIKVMAYQLLQQIEVTPCEKTCIPAKLATDSFNLFLKGGHWLRFKKRNQGNV